MIIHQIATTVKCAAALARTQFAELVIASEAWRSREGNGGRFSNETATSLRFSR